MRKTCDSSKTSCITALSSIAVPRSRPNGFSNTILSFSRRRASPVHAVGGGRRRHGRVEEPPALGAELRIQLLQVRAELHHRAGLGERATEIGQPPRELVPRVAVGGARGEL